MVYPSSMRASVSATGLYTYPDVVVVCGEPRFLDGRQDTLLNPTFLAEVLSPSEAYRGRKFEHYGSIESLQNYLMVASDRQDTDLYTYARQPDRRWLLTPASRPGALRQSARRRVLLALPACSAIAPFC